MHTVNHAIIHKLVKDKHGKATVVERSGDLPLTEPVKKLVTDIHELYSSRAAKGYGRFEADDTNYPSSKILRTFFEDGTVAFSEASRQLLSVLSAKVTSVALATGGYVLMAQVTNVAGVSWFIVAILNNVDGSAIDDVKLEIVKAVHVDLENLRVAGRVNITDWLGTDQDVRYVGFLKQRGDVAEYFKQFLGCSEIITDTEETKKLVTVLKGFAKSEGMDEKQTAEFLHAAYIHCFECNKASEQISLDALANKLWPDEPTKLKKTFARSGIQISDGFVPDGRSIRGLMRMRSKTEFWTIDLDRHALANGYAHYNQKKGELTLKKLPSQLKAELDREIDGGN